MITQSLDSIHHKNIIQALAIEIFKIKHKLCLLLVIFLWKGQTTSTIFVIVLSLKPLKYQHSVFHRTESNSYLEPKIWYIVPEEFKHKKSLLSFKKSIKRWVPTNCLCRLCKVYLDEVDLLIRFNIATNNFPATTSFSSQ